MRRKLVGAVREWTGARWRLPSTTPTTSRGGSTRARDAGHRFRAYEIRADGGPLEAQVPWQFLAPSLLEVGARAAIEAARYEADLENEGAATFERRCKAGFGMGKVDLGWEHMSEMPSLRELLGALERPEEDRTRLGRLAHSAKAGQHKQVLKTVSHLGEALSASLLERLSRGGPTRLSREGVHLESSRERIPGESLPEVAPRALGTRSSLFDGLS